MGKDSHLFHDHAPQRKVVALMKGDVPLNWNMLRWFQSNRPPRWGLTVIGSMLLNPWEQIRRLKPDGLLMHANLWDELPADIAEGIPKVGLITQSFCDVDQPMVVTDETCAASLVVNHLSEAGFRHFAYLGFEGFKSSKEKETGFRRAAVGVGGTCEVYDESLFPVSFKDNARKKRRLTDWVKGLCKPVGIFAQNDMWATVLVEVCLQAGFRIPEEIAVVGMDNDLVVCEGCEIPISSVVPDLAGIGYRAQVMLETLMSGETPSARMVPVPPLSLEIRTSSDVRMAKNVPLACAYDFIRREALSGIGVCDVVTASGTARRSLERIFRRQIGRSILQEIQRIRLENAMKLLHGSDEILKVIADQSGFSSVEQMSIQFKKEYGAAPAVWREQNRAGSMQLSPDR